MGSLNADEMEDTLSSSMPPDMGNFRRSSHAARAAAVARQLQRNAPSPQSVYYLAYPLILAAGWIITWINTRRTEAVRGDMNRVNEQLREFYGPMQSITAATQASYEAMIQQYLELKKNRAGNCSAIHSVANSAQSSAIRRQSSLASIANNGAGSGGVEASPRPTVANTTSARRIRVIAKQTTNMSDEEAAEHASQRAAAAAEDAIGRCPPRVKVIDPEPKASVSVPPSSLRARLPPPPKTASFASQRRPRITGNRPSPSDVVVPFDPRQHFEPRRSPPGSKSASAMNSTSSDPPPTQQPASKAPSALKPATITPTSSTTTTPTTTTAATAASPSPSALPAAKSPSPSTPYSPLRRWRTVPSTELPPTGGESPQHRMEILRKAREDLQQRRERHRKEWHAALAESKPDDPNSAALHYRRWATEVLQPLNERALEVLIRRADLMDTTSVPVVFRQFAAHVLAFRTLMAQWKSGDYSQTRCSVTYPENFAPFVAAEFRRLKLRQADQLNTLHHIPRNQGSGSLWAVEMKDLPDSRSAEVPGSLVSLEDAVVWGAASSWTSSRRRSRL